MRSRGPLTVLLDKLSPRRRILRRYVRALGRSPRPHPPVGYNEHITHRLLYDRDPRLKIICDKIAVKKLVTNRVGAEYVVPLLGAWRRAEDIAWNILPESFVLKPNQSFGRCALVENRSELDVAALTAEARSWFRETPRKFLNREMGLPRHFALSYGRTILARARRKSGARRVCFCIQRTGRNHSAADRAQVYERAARRLVRHTRAAIGAQVSDCGKCPRITRSRFAQ